jgi:K+-sensing histidine kinase KdpD
MQALSDGMPAVQLLMLLPVADGAVDGVVSLTLDPGNFQEPAAHRAVRANVCMGAAHGNGELLLEEPASRRAAAQQRGIQFSVVLPLAGALRACGHCAAAHPQECDDAQDAGCAKSAFLANISHEIRTPRNATMGLNHLVRPEGVAPAQAERPDKVDAASQHLLASINDVLD